MGLISCPMDLPEHQISTIEYHVTAVTWETSRLVPHISHCIKHVIATYSKHFPTELNPVNCYSWVDRTLVLGQWTAHIEDGSTGFTTTGDCNLVASDFLLIQHKMAIRSTSASFEPCRQAQAGWLYTEITMPSNAICLLSERAILCIKFNHITAAIIFAKDIFRPRVWGSRWRTREAILLIINKAFIQSLQTWISGNELVKTETVEPRASFFTGSHRNSELVYHVAHGDTLSSLLDIRQTSAPLLDESSWGIASVCDM